MIDDEKLKATLAAATKGPWRLHESDDGWNMDVSGTNGVVAKDWWLDFAKVVIRSRSHDGWSDNPRGKANAALIALAPDLAAEVLTLRAENARLREAGKALAEVLGPFAEAWDCATSGKPTGTLGDFVAVAKHHTKATAYPAARAALSAWEAAQ